jgi:flagellar hook-associated protein 3 FlgL
MLSFQDDTLNEASNLIVRGKEIAEQAANETLSADLRANLAAEVFSLRDSLVGLANSRYQGRFIYGGADDDDEPFDPLTYTNSRFAGDPAGVRYVFDAEPGTDQTRDVEISDSDPVRVNSSGGDIFSNGIASLERLGRALVGFRTTPEDLSTLPDGGGVAFNFPAEYGEQTSDIRECIDLLEEARLDISGERTSVGGRMNQIVQAESILSTLNANLTNARSTYQDADPFLAASNLANLEVALRGTLASGARLQNLSLLDFLG